MKIDKTFVAKWVRGTHFATTLMSCYPDVENQGDSFQYAVDQVFNVWKAMFGENSKESIDMQLGGCVSLCVARELHLSGAIENALINHLKETAKLTGIELIDMDNGNADPLFIERRQILKLGNKIAGFATYYGWTFQRAVDEAVKVFLFKLEPNWLEVSLAAFAKGTP